jgi:hypothetical protein
MIILFNVMTMGVNLGNRGKKYREMFIRELTRGIIDLTRAGVREMDVRSIVEESGESWEIWKPIYERIKTRIEKGKN